MQKTTPPVSSTVVISVVIPVRNGMKFLPRCLSALRKALALAPESEIIVVDNGSTDGTVEWALSAGIPGLRVHVLPGVTVATLRNTGARLAAGSILSFVDSDCLLREDYYPNALDLLRTTQAAAVGSFYDLPPNPTRIELAWDSLHRTIAEGPTHMINAGNLVMQKSAFQEVGGFRESLVTGEDAELGLRLQQGGHVMVQSPLLSAAHIGNPTTFAAFFRKELWHGRGALGTASLRKIDRPLAMTCLQAAALLAAMFLLLSADSWGIALALILPFLLPVLTVMYRRRDGRHLRYPALGVLLYFDYYLARICALPLAVLDAIRGTRSPNPTTSMARRQ